MKKGIKVAAGIAIVGGLAYLGNNIWKDMKKHEKEVKVSKLERFTEFYSGMNDGIISESQNKGISETLSNLDEVNNFLKVCAFNEGLFIPSTSVFDSYVVDRIRATKIDNDMTLFGEYTSASKDKAILHSEFVDSMSSSMDVFKSYLGDTLQKTKENNTPNININDLTPVAQSYAQTLAELSDVVQRDVEYLESVKACSNQLDEEGKRIYELASEMIENRILLGQKAAYLKKNLESNLDYFSTLSDMTSLESALETNTFSESESSISNYVENTNGYSAETNVVEDGCETNTPGKVSKVWDHLKNNGLKPQWSTDVEQKIVNGSKEIVVDASKSLALKAADLYDRMKGRGEYTATNVQQDIEVLSKQVGKDISAK